MAQSSARRKVEVEWTTVAEACEMTGLAQGTIYRHIREGRLQGYRIANKTMLEAEEVRRFARPQPIAPTR